MIVDSKIGVGLSIVKQDERTTLGGGDSRFLFTTV